MRLGVLQGTRLHLGETRTFGLGRKHYTLHGVAESLTDLLTCALTLRDLDALRVVIAPLPAGGYGVWINGLTCCLHHQGKEGERGGMAV